MEELANQVEKSEKDIRGRKKEMRKTLHTAKETN
jgi:hypothetical protein